MQSNALVNGPNGILANGGEAMEKDDGGDDEDTINFTLPTQQQLQDS